ncbi:MAG: low molecular weight protein arginine phosphatase [Actinobacteria bacterium]|nr:low molecular weight protein arginine phosphatase [Actinomycetota bacterium]
MLFLCTGNICRSPMAEGMLRHRLAARGHGARVHSAGLLDAGRPASAHGVDVLGARGIDLGSHRSRTLTAELVRGADLVLGMARMHVREAVVLVPAAWPRAFTLKELVRRGEEIGPRSAGQPLEEWLSKAHAGRSRSDLMGDSDLDDIFDPIGSPRSRYEATAAEIEDLTDRLVALVLPEEAHDA